MFELNTFSITARCPRTGMLGVAVSTAVPAVGGICSYIKEGVGAIATQSRVNPYLGIEGLKLLEQGLSAEETLTKLLADDPGAMTVRSASSTRRAARPTETAFDVTHF